MSSQNNCFIFNTFIINKKKSSPSDVCKFRLFVSIKICLTTLNPEFSVNFVLIGRIYRIINIMFRICMFIGFFYLLQNEFKSKLNIVLIYLTVIPRRKQILTNNLFSVNKLHL